MLDALCQAIESWWSVSATEESIGYAKRAVAAVMENWEAYLFAPTEAAAEKVLEAANLSGRAIRITATTAPHAMSYKLTTQYQIPHGHAVALCLAQVWDYVRRHTDACQDPHGVSYLEGVLEAISALVSPEAFSAMLKTCGMEHPISQSRTAELEALVQSVNPLRLKNNPVDLSRETLKALYERIVIE
jgi:alcohol dehydrogenase class IV